MAFLQEDCGRIVKEKNLLIIWNYYRAIFLALKIFASEMSDCEILLRVDNTTAISYINKMGGTRFLKYNKLSRQIWQCYEARKLYIFASYIPSKENTEANRKSKINNIDTEWEVSSRIFLQIVKFPWQS